MRPATASTGSLGRPKVRKTAPLGVTRSIVDASCSSCVFAIVYGPVIASCGGVQGSSRSTTSAPVSSDRCHQHDRRHPRPHAPPPVRRERADQQRDDQVPVHEQLGVVPVPGLEDDEVAGGEDDQRAERELEQRHRERRRSARARALPAGETHRDGERDEARGAAPQSRGWRARTPTTAWCRPCPSPGSPHRTDCRSDRLEPPARVGRASGVGQPARLEPRVHVAAVGRHRRRRAARAASCARRMPPISTATPASANHSRRRLSPEQHEEQDRQGDQGLDVDDRQQADQHARRARTAPSSGRAMTHRRARAASTEIAAAKPKSRVRCGSHHAMSGVYHCMFGERRSAAVGRQPVIGAGLRGDQCRAGRAASIPRSTRRCRDG